MRRTPILQLHPTLRCNLRCRHCYSVSGPGRHESLAIGLLERAVADAAAAGFRSVSVSGGEPFLYPDLGRLLAAARATGMRTGVTSNGTAITERRLAEVAGRLDGMAISVDGRPDRHNAIRGSASAFDRLVRGVERVRAAGIPLGVIHTLTADGWEDLPWVAEFAADAGAGLLQIHPLEPAGRARSELAGAVPPAAVNERAYLLAKAIEARYEGRLAVQLDLLLRRDILALPEIVYAGEPGDCDRPGLDSLVLEEDATLVPISYGFSRRYAIGNLRSRPLAGAFASWRESGRHAFRALCRELVDQVRAEPDRLVNWHERIVELSHRARAGGRSAGTPAAARAVRG